MKTSKQGIDLIKQFEGVKHKMYKDVVGLPTIGVGHLITEKDKHLLTATLSEEEVEMLLKKDLERFEFAVNSLGVKLNQNEFDALVSLAFNIGTSAFVSSTLAKKLRTKHLREEVAAEFLRWNKAGGKEVEGLTRRRKAEKELFLKNE